MPESHSKYDRCSRCNTRLQWVEGVVRSFLVPYCRQCKTVALDGDPVSPNRKVIGISDWMRLKRGLLIDLGVSLDSISDTSDLKRRADEVLTLLRELSQRKKVQAERPRTKPASRSTRWAARKGD